MLLKRNYHNSGIKSVTVQSNKDGNHTMAIRTIGGTLICVSLPIFTEDMLDGYANYFWNRYHDEQWAAFELG